VNEWIDVRDFLCTPGQAVGYPVALCSRTCSFCIDDTDAAWCPSATVTISPDPGITKYNISGTWTEPMCWTSGPTVWTDTDVSFTVQNLPVKMSVTCAEAIGIPQWAQCDVSGVSLLIGPILVIILLLALIIVIIVYCCPCFKKGEAKGKADKKESKPEEPKEAHPIFDQWSKVDVKVESKSNEDTSIEMEDKPSVMNTKKAVDGGYKAPERKPLKPEPAVPVHTHPVQHEEHDTSTESSQPQQPKGNPFRPGTLTIDVNDLDDYFKDA